MWINPLHAKMAMKRPTLIVYLLVMAILSKETNVHYIMDCKILLQSAHRRSWRTSTFIDLGGRKKVTHQVHSLPRISCNANFFSWAFCFGT
jgi:hypothetical protein